MMPKWSMTQKAGMIRLNRDCKPRKMRPENSRAMKNRLVISRKAGPQRQTRKKFSIPGRVHFTPTIAKAAVEVLEHAGYQVRIPRQTLCCGLPLYDYGMLDKAKGLLRQILASLCQSIRDGIPIVGLEPSCMTVFRDELTNLLYGDEDAKRLSQQSCSCMTK
jgi:Fe-S oxidoreductase